ncbi:MAG: TIGR03032 family protein, partial [Magnetococcus sp. YQC-5]
PWQAGYAARQAVRIDPTVGTGLQTLKLGPWQDAASGDALLGRPAFSQASALAGRFSSWLKRSPGDWLTWLYLARLREISVPDGSPHSDQDALQQATRLEFVPGESLHWMGVWRLNAGDAPGAVKALSALLEIRPVRHGSMMYLGDALLRVGNIAAAEKAFARASLSSNADFLLTLSAKVYANNYWQEAVDILQKAIDIRPESVPILLSLAKIQSEVYALADCRATLTRLQTLEPDHPDARLLDAGLHGRMGDARGHLALLQSAYTAGGDPLSRLASSVAMTALYNDIMTPVEVSDLHRRVCSPIEASVLKTTDFANPRTSNRRLRVGFVTGDLHRQHPVNIFILPVLLRFDRARLDVHVYHTGNMHDAYTRQAQASVDGWLEATALDDLSLLQAIIADGIDILVDLAGHTSSHRLGVFAMRAAPVQATFLGYPHSTGLSTIDWLVGDAIVSPAEHAQLFSEGLAQLPDSLFCWAPVDEYPLPPPRSACDPVVFGSFNNAMKLSPKTIQLWARVLRAVPDALLLLKAPALRDMAVQERFTDLFAKQGIASNRLVFRGPSGLADMMQEYGDIDIALDPTPYNGGTTTLQALWMGVPVVTLTGGNFVSRMGASFMQALGQPDWIAGDGEKYVEIAASLARDHPSWRKRRAQLRERMLASPLCNIHGYTSNFENLLHRMWQAYCRNENLRLLQVENKDMGARLYPSADTSSRQDSVTALHRISPLQENELASHSSLEITTSRQMLSWLAEQRLSIVLTTYQFGKLFLLGLKPNGELSVFERSLNRCTGLCPTDNGFYLSSAYQVWRFENLFTQGQKQDGYDRLYIPQVGNTTGDLDIHDMAVGADNRLIFVNTLFSCLATLSETHSFTAIWRPSFISKLSAEDRCHLNGLAMRDGRPSYVTAVSDSDVVDGWRDHRADGGIVVDIDSNEIVARGLSMPHSPRWYQDKLWLLNSGTGEFGHIELDSGRFVPITFCAGYMRGISFHGHFALVGLSLPRHNKTFIGLPLDENLKKRNAQARCGIQVIDLRTGDAVHWLRVEGVVNELYDIITLPGVRRPMALGFKTDEIERVLSVEE